MTTSKSIDQRLSTAARSQMDDLRDLRVPDCLGWSCEDVANWLDEIGLGIYKNCFLTNNINGIRLIKVHASTLPQLGITDFEHIKIISKGIRDLLNIELEPYSKSIALPPRSDLAMYLEWKSHAGHGRDTMSFDDYEKQVLRKKPKWQPPLSNMCHIIPIDARESVFYRGPFEPRDETASAAKFIQFQHENGDSRMK